MERTNESSAGPLARRLFVAGCVVLVLTGVLHLVAELSGPQAPANDTERQLMDLMTSYKRDMLGSPRTTMDLFNGFGVQFTISLVALAGASLIAIRGRAGLVRPLAVFNSLALVAMTANSVVYFFVIPTVCMGLGAVLFAAAFLASGRRNA